MMREFEYGAKRIFNETYDQDYFVDLRGVDDDPENGIVDESITIKTCDRVCSLMCVSDIDQCRDDLRAVFDHVCLQIEDLICEQIAGVSEHGLQVKVIFSVANTPFCG